MDLIDRQSAIDALNDEFTITGKTNAIVIQDYIRRVSNRLHDLPSAQPEQEREFIKLTVRDSNGRPYFSIIYLEVDKNGVGHDFEGYSSYDLDVISDYLKIYFGFGTSAQPVARDNNVLSNDLINRQQAIDQLHQSYNLFDAERRLEDMPAAQPESCEDAVSRQALKKGFNEMCDLACPYTKKQRHIMCGCCGLGTAFDVLEATPSVTPKEQRWIPYGKRKPDKPTISGLYIVSGIWKSGSAFVCPCAYNGELGRFETPYNSYIVAWMSLPEPYKAESEEV